MEIRRVTQAEAVEAAVHLFDAPVRRGATEQFLADDHHHLSIACLGGVQRGWSLALR